MALAHERIHVSQPTLLQAERIRVTDPVLDSHGNVVRWGDPNSSFVGDPDSASISTRYSGASGYGTYAPNISRVARQFGGKVIWSGPHLTRKMLESAIRNNHPVIAWIGDRAGHMRWAPLSVWKAWNGTRVEYPTPSSGVYEHCVLIVGVDSDRVYVYDPLDGARNGSNINPVVGAGWVLSGTFYRAFQTFHNMAVVLE
jgi:uncharacterized protein YvpB